MMYYLEKIEVFQKFYVTIGNNLVVINKNSMITIDMMEW